MARQGRGHLSGIQLLPPEVSHIVQWANGELQAENRTQKDIYAEFVQRLKAAIAESAGALEFAIPSATAFNRYSLAQDALLRDIRESHEVTAALAREISAKQVDEMTVIAAESLKSQVLSFLQKHRGQLKTKDLKALSDTLRTATQAQNISTNRAAIVEKETNKRLGKVEAVARKAGISEEAIAEINRRLGVI